MGGQFPFLLNLLIEGRLEGRFGHMSAFLIHTGLPSKVMILEGGGWCGGGDR